MLTTRDLLKAKARAVRFNLWFKALSRTERAIINLTLKCVERVRSDFLERTISSIIDKIIEALENRFLSNAAKVGSEIAQGLSRIAQEWGNISASEWAKDEFFIKFLGVNAINSS